MSRRDTTVHVIAAEGHAALEPWSGIQLDDLYVLANARADDVTGQDVTDALSNAARYMNHVQHDRHSFLKQRMLDDIATRQRAIERLRENASVDDEYTFRNLVMQDIADMYGWHLLLVAPLAHTTDDVALPNGFRTAMRTFIVKLGDPDVESVDIETHFKRLLDTERIRQGQPAPLHAVDTESAMSDLQKALLTVAYCLVPAGKGSDMPALDGRVYLPITAKAGKWPVFLAYMESQLTKADAALRDGHPIAPPSVGFFYHGLLVESLGNVPTHFRMSNSAIDLGVAAKTRIGAFISSVGIAKGWLQSAEYNTHALHALDFTSPNGNALPQLPVLSRLEY